MTTALAPSLPFRIYQPDILLDNIKVNLSTEQRKFIDLNKEMGRPLLFKLFKRKFNLNINKLQFNTALAEIKGEEVMLKPPSPSIKVNLPRPDVPHYRNVQWVTQQGVWAVRFKRDGKIKHIARRADLSEAVQIAEEYRNNLA